jgi:hypothetical protein
MKDIHSWGDFKERYNAIYGNCDLAKYNTNTLKRIISSNDILIKKFEIVKKFPELYKYFYLIETEGKHGHELFPIIFNKHPTYENVYGLKV